MEEIRALEFLLPPAPEDREWAWEALTDLRVRWEDPHPVVLEMLAEELAARRATARLQGPEAAGLVARAITDYDMPPMVAKPFWRLLTERPMGGMAVLLAMAVPQAHAGTGRHMDPGQILRDPRTYRWVLEEASRELLVPGRDGLARVGPVAERIGMEIRPEEPGRKVREEVRAIREEMARLAWIVDYLPPAEAAARAEEAAGLAERLQRRAWDLQMALHRLRAWGALEAEVEAMAVLADLGMLPGQENVRAARVPLSRSRALERLQAHRGRRGVVRLGLARVWIGRDGVALPLDQARRRIDPRQLREEAERLEALARRYRARAAALRGEPPISFRPLRRPEGE